MGGFNLGLFTNIFNRTIDLVPLRDIVSRPPAHDWTEYVIGEIEIDTRDKPADVICWKKFW